MASVQEMPNIVDVQTMTFGHEQLPREHSRTSFKEEANMSELLHPNESREYPCNQEEGWKDFHLWGTELSANQVDTVWPYWNLMDFTPEGRPDIPTAPQKFNRPPDGVHTPCTAREGVC
jgi:predicted dithiol-disulfide oxidoreductase (DUF899 family)